VELLSIIMNQNLSTFCHSSKLMKLISARDIFLVRLELDHSLEVHNALIKNWILNKNVSIIRSVVSCDRTTNYRTNSLVSAFIRRCNLRIPYLYPNIFRLHLPGLHVFKQIMMHKLQSRYEELTS